MRLIIMGLAGATAIAYNTADTEQKFPVGTCAFGIPGDFSAVANTLNAGGDFIYMKSAAATAVGVPVTFNSNTRVFTQVANTPNLATAIGFAANRFTAADQWGWVQVSGMTPVVNNGTFAADAAIYIQAAGTLSSTQANGKQILGARSVIAAAAAITKAGCQTTNGMTTLKVPNTDGLFCGLAVSGTGIAASTITDIDPGGNIVTLSAAMTASGRVTATFTYTNLGAAMINHPHAQGQTV